MCIAYVVYTTPMYAHFDACDAVIKKIAFFIDKYNSRSGLKRISLADKIRDIYRTISKIWIGSFKI